MAGLSDREALLSITADTLGFQFSGTSAPETQLLNYLRQKEMLLIFDNFEHLLDEAVSVLMVNIRNDERDKPACHITRASQFGGGMAIVHRGINVSQ